MTGGRRKDFDAGSSEHESQGQSVNVEIYNQTYAIRASDGNVERTLRLAAMVDERMREISKSALTSDSLRLAVLAALHIADELEKAKSKYEDLNQNSSTAATNTRRCLINCSRITGTEL